MYSSTTPHTLLSLLFLYYNSVFTWWGYKSIGAQLWLFLFLESCCLCLASLSQCPQTHTVVVSPSLIETDRGEDYTVSNEKTPSKIHIRIWRKSNVGSRLWKDWFWLCPIFIQCTWCRAHRGEKNWDAIGTVWQREKNTMQLCFINCQLHQNPFLLKVYLYLHISFSQYPEKVYEYFTIWRNSLEVN